MNRFIWHLSHRTRAHRPERPLDPVPSLTLNPSATKNEVSLEINGGRVRLERLQDFVTRMAALNKVFPH
jgi:hypothetical protein